MNGRHPIIAVTPWKLRNKPPQKDFEAETPHEAHACAAGKPAFPLLLQSYCVFNPVCLFKLAER